MHRVRLVGCSLCIHRQNVSHWLSENQNASKGKKQRKIKPVGCKLSYPKELDEQRDLQLAIGLGLTEYTNSHGVRPAGCCFGIHR